MTNSDLFIFMLFGYLLAVLLADFFTLAFFATESSVRPCLSVNTIPLVSGKVQILPGSWRTVTLDGPLRTSHPRSNRNPEPGAFTANNPTIASPPLVRRSRSTLVNGCVDLRLGICNGQVGSLSQLCHCKTLTGRRKCQRSGFERRAHAERSI